MKNAPQKAPMKDRVEIGARVLGIDTADFKSYVIFAQLARVLTEFKHCMHCKTQHLSRDQSCRVAVADKAVRGSLNIDLQLSSECI